jgi:AcrR family transcriptional regulator
MNDALANASSAKRPAGRPRRLTLEAIVEAACEIGIDRIEMTALAERLGIGAATLYGYVQSRDHLVRLAAARLGRHERIVDRGQSWQDALREHAAITFEIYQAWPQLIGQMLNGTVSTHVESSSLESLLAILIDRGVDPADGLGLFYEVNQAVVGAAVGLAYRRALDSLMGGYEAMVEGVLADHMPDERPALRRCFEASRTPTTLGEYAPAVDRILAAHETRMAQAAAAPATQPT